MEKQFKSCSLTLLEKGTWLVIIWGKTMEMMLSNVASRSIISGKLSLALSWCPEVEKQRSSLQAACAPLPGSPKSMRLRVSVQFSWRPGLSQRVGA